MRETYGRDLDLNLLRVFAVVAETGSVTQAAGRLYLTQPAVSAALRRLHDAVGAPLFARLGRGLVLTARGERLLAQARPHLQALVRGSKSCGASARSGSACRTPPRSGSCRRSCARSSATRRACG